VAAWAVLRRSEKSWMQWQKQCGRQTLRERISWESLLPHAPANVVVSGAVFRGRSKGVLGGSVSIPLPNLLPQSAVAPSLQSGDPSSCQLFQHVRCVRLGCFA
jgi:hypothetical protein